MQITLQTAFNAPSVIYDSEAPPSAVASAVNNFLRPVVQVQQGNITLYKTDDFYPDMSTQNILIGLAVVFSIGYGIYRIMR